MAGPPVRRSADLGAALAELRVDRGDTQAQFADAIGISTAYLAKIEQGRTTPLLDRVVDALRRAGATIEVTWPAHATDAATDRRDDDADTAAVSTTPVTAGLPDDGTADQRPRRPQ